MDVYQDHEMSSAADFTIGGTHIWYYFICKREVWLISHKIDPEQEDQNLRIGRHIAEESYGREKKEIAIGNSIIDIFHEDNGRMVIGEVKKSSKYRDSARMQLAFYLLQLRELGVKAIGELRFPKEKIREEVTLDEQTVSELSDAIEEIKKIIRNEVPPQPAKINWCLHCAYGELCWC